MKIVKTVKVDLNERTLRSAIAQLQNLRAYLKGEQSTVTNLTDEDKKKATLLINSAMNEVEGIKKELGVWLKQTR